MLAAGVPATDVQVQLGHTSLQMISQHYHHTDNDELLKTIRKKSPKLDFKIPKWGLISPKP
jgi:integrase